MKVIDQQKRLSTLQGESIYALKNLVSVLKTAGIEQTANAISGVSENQKEILDKKLDDTKQDALNQAAGTASEINSAIEKGIDPVGKVGGHIKGMKETVKTREANSRTTAKNCQKLEKTVQVKC